MPGAPAATPFRNPGVILIGCGERSANLGALLKSLDPTLRIRLHAVTAEFAQECSHGWNHAGTGHAGNCVHGYPPDREPEGSITVAHAVRIFEQFAHPGQFWA